MPLGIAERTVNLDKVVAAGKSVLIIDYIDIASGLLRTSNKNPLAFRQRSMSKQVRLIYFDRATKVPKRLEFRLNSRDKIYAYCNRSIKCSPTLSALAIIVKAGLTLAFDGKKLPSTT
jgi:hypothetical protein